MRNFEKFKKFLYSKFVLIVLIALFIIFNVISFFSEKILGKIDYQSVLLLRITTIVWDIIILGSGLFLRFQIHTRKKLKKILGNKKLFWILYISDTLAIGILLFGPYIGKLLVLLKLERIDEIIFRRNFWINAIALIILGFFVKSITRQIKKWSRKIFRKKHVHKNKE